MYVSLEEIKTHLYYEQIITIADGDPSKLLKAINVAIAEVRGYLAGRYDIDAELAKSGEDRNELLVLWIKDIAVWHFVNICNVNTSLELRAKRRDDAVSELVKIQKGNFDIALPSRRDESGRELNSTPFALGSNKRRESHI
jgi:phage gp36-like protein